MNSYTAQWIVTLCNDWKLQHSKQWSLCWCNTDNYLLIIIKYHFFFFCCYLFQMPAKQLLSGQCCLPLSGKAWMRLPIQRLLWKDHCGRCTHLCWYAKSFCISDRKLRSKQTHCFSSLALQTNICDKDNSVHINMAACVHGLNWINLLQKFTLICLSWFSITEHSLWWSSSPSSCSFCLAIK